MELRNQTSDATRRITRMMGSTTAVIIASTLVVAWLVVGALNGFEGRWFDILYSVGAATTFLMIFLLSHAEGRDSRAAMLKLDALVEAVDGASESLIGIEQRGLAHQEHMEGGPFAEIDLDTRVRRFEVLEDLDSVVRLVEEQPGLYLRYSEGPEVDRGKGASRDHEADIDLPGLSVTTITPESWWDRPLQDWVARRICKYAELAEQGRYPWLLRGRRVGNGPDHEPLVEMQEPVARITPHALEEAKRHYEAHFDVGEDSRT